MIITVKPKTVHHPSTIEILLILMYNIALLAGASFLVYYKDASAWVYFVAILFGATWKSDKEEA